MEARLAGQRKAVFPVLALPCVQALASLCRSCVGIDRPLLEASFLVCKCHPKGRKQALEVGSSHECLVYFRSQQMDKPFAAKEDLNCDLAGDFEPNPEAHLPSICLKQVFPKYAKQFNYLRLVDRMANLFIRFLGIKGTMKLGPTGFRTFIRLVRPASSSLSFGEGGAQSLLWMVIWPMAALGRPWY